MSSSGTSVGRVIPNPPTEATLEHGALRKTRPTPTEWTRISVH